ncbi:MAG: glycine cleavage system protein H [Pirellulaceae bacterium]|nr:glycine cleavage system protein H [Pirellulaceae bacterium]
MSQALVFMMGDFAAEIPTDRRYARNHMWAVSIGENTVRFGLSAYAVRLLQDVYFIEFSVESGTSIASRQEIGAIESKKAESGIYAPTQARLNQINTEILADPSAINVDKYGDGWLFDLDQVAETLLTAEEYVAHLENAWEVAQRTIKGQANAE